MRQAILDYSASGRDLIKRWGAEEGGSGQLDRSVSERDLMESRRGSVVVERCDGQLERSTSERVVMESRRGYVVGEGCDGELESWRGK